MLVLAMGDTDNCDACRTLLDEIATVQGDGARRVDELPLIMIVDDEEFLRLSLRLAFRSHFRPLVAESAEDALGQLTDEVNAVVLDVKMPDRDGFWAYQAIRQRYAYLPIIFYSAYEDLKQPYDVMNRYRPYGYIFKGREFRELLESVTSAVAYYQDLRRMMRAAAKLDAIVALAAELRGGHGS